jgi:serine/threonine protein kinase
VLPDSVARDPDHLARFQREAQVLAALNHPNIAQIHGLEETGGGSCAVMELGRGRARLLVENLPAAYAAWGRVTLPV